MWLDSLRCLFDHPHLLAADPSARELLARAQTVTISVSAAVVASDVDRSRIANVAVAAPHLLSNTMDVAPRCPSILDQPLDLLAVGKGLQPSPTRWLARSFARASRTTFSHLGNSRPGTASGLPGAFLWDAGVERRHRAGGLLRANCLRHDHRHDHDSIGGGGTRATIRRRISNVSQESTGSDTQLLGWNSSVTRLVENI